MQALVPVSIIGEGRGSLSGTDKLVSSSLSDRFGSIVQNSEVDERFCSMVQDSDVDERFCSRMQAMVLYLRHCGSHCLYI